VGLIVNSIGMAKSCYVYTSSNMFGKCIMRLCRQETNINFILYFLNVKMRINIWPFLRLKYKERICNVSAGKFLKIPVCDSRNIIDVRYDVKTGQGLKTLDILPSSVTRSSREREPHFILSVVPAWRHCKQI
jgi:hypothetical protein